MSDRKEAEAASKQKRDMLKPTGTGDRDRQGPEGSVRRNRRAHMLLGTRWGQGGREGCSRMENKKGGRERGFSFPVWH